MCIVISPLSTPKRYISASFFTLTRSIFLSITDFIIAHYEVGDGQNIAAAFSHDYALIAAIHYRIAASSHIIKRVSRYSAIRLIILQQRHYSLPAA